MLNPEQENLRKKLERIGSKDLVACDQENGLYVFEIVRDDNERSEFQHKPLDTDIETKMRIDIKADQPDEKHERI